MSWLCDRCGVQRAGAAAPEPALCERCKGLPPDLGFDVKVKNETEHALRVDLDLEVIGQGRPTLFLVIRTEHS